MALTLNDKSAVNANGGTIGFASQSVEHVNAFDAVVSA
jgi:hypothetical protein